MSTYSGPEILGDGLILSLDAGNIKSYPYHPGTMDHGISEWYCFVSGAATYSCSESNTTIYQVTDTGVVTTAVASSVNPQNGFMTVTAGYRYYGNKAIFLTVEDQHHSIVPLSMASNLFIHISGRVGSELGTVYFYAPFSSAVVTMYTAGTGINGTATSTISLTKGQSGTFSLTTLNWYYFTSTSPVIGSVNQNGSDKTILSPVNLTSYQRYSNYYITSIGGTPSNIGAYVISDTTYPVIAASIADGSGGDSAQGLAYEYLCDRYSWGNVLSDYIIVTPYPNTIITTYYWSGTAWIIWESHSLTSGTMLSPAQAQRDGTAGPGVTATSISGLAANMASGATLWKWEGNNPFYLCINDAYDDEISLLGWMNSRNTRTISDLDTNWYDTSGLSNTATLQGNTKYVSDVGGAINMWANGSGKATNSSSVVDAITNTSSFTFSITFRINSYPTVSIATTSGLLQKGSYNPSYGLNLIYAGDVGGLRTQVQLFGGIRNLTGTSGVTQGYGLIGPTSSTLLTKGQWYHADLTHEYVGTTHTIKIYLNGIIDTVSTQTNSLFPINFQNSSLIGINNNVLSGNGLMSDITISNYAIYNRSLSESEIRQNFNSTRSKYGL